MSDPRAATHPEYPKPPCTEPPERPVPPNPPEFDFYVMFHGVFAFYEHPGSDIIDVFVAKDEAHDCMAGSFLTEHAIRGPRGVLFLEGVVPGNPGCTLWDHAYVIHTNREVAPSPDYGLQIRLPRPQRIYWDLLIEDVTVEFALQEEQKLCWGLVPIFAYKAATRDPITLSGMDFLWTAPKHDCPPITLHIWASGDMPWDGGGPKAAAELLGERITIKLPDPFCYRSELPPDLAGSEHESAWRLSERYAELKNFAAALRERKSAEKVPEFVANIMPIMPSACGPVGGGGKGG
jgi:hypothetical protein